MNIATLANRRFVIAITGSIAAYKSADLVRRLYQAGAAIRVVMTKAACEFITPLTLQALSGHPVALELLDADEESAMGHIALARWAEWIVVAPASADAIARLAQGRSDDLLSALCLVSERPLALVPAMNHAMWTNQATQANLKILKMRGVYMLGPASGRQACNEEGEGRLLEPIDIVHELARLVVPPTLKGKRVVVTAGPTYEPIDPVRFIGNRSSGKMGFAVASAAVEAGADVTLITGPVHLGTPTAVQRIDVDTAQEMLDSTLKTVRGSDIFIACAAVADYQPKHRVERKIKKMQHDSLQLCLQPTRDILLAVTSLEDAPFTVGFAAETESVAEQAKTKLQHKHADMIVGNEIGKHTGFAVDNNEFYVVWHGGEQHLPLTPKTQLARDLIALIIKQYYAKNST